MHVHLSTKCAVFAIASVSAWIKACEPAAEADFPRTGTDVQNPVPPPNSYGNDLDDAESTGAPLSDAGTPDSEPCSDRCEDAGDPFVAVPVTVSLEGDGCPPGSSSGLTAERIPLSRFEVSDPAGGSRTLRKYCVVVHEIEVPRGHQIAGGGVMAEADVSLPPLGRGTIRFRTQVDQSSPILGLTAINGQNEGPWTASGQWPTLEACEGTRIFRVETQVSVTLRAERRNTEPRRISVKALRFPRLFAVPCGPRSGA